jgi:hypothetical protein
MYGIIFNSKRIDFLLPRKHLFYGFIGRLTQKLAFFLIFKGIRSLQKRFLLKAKSLFTTKKHSIYLFIN